MKVDSSHSDGNTPMPGWGLSLILWNMPRMSAVALTGDTPGDARPAARIANQCAVLQLAAALSVARSAPRPSPATRSAAGLFSRTKNPRFLRASTSPCASNWSYAATTVEGLTPFCSAHCRTEGRRDPGASKRLRMRSANRAESCSVSDWVGDFINMGLSRRARLCTVLPSNTDSQLR